MFGNLTIGGFDPIPAESVNEFRGLVGIALGPVKALGRVTGKIVVGSGRLLKRAASNKLAVAVTATVCTVSVMVQPASATWAAIAGLEPATIVTAVSDAANGYITAGIALTIGLGMVAAIKRGAFRGSRKIVS